MGFRSPEVETLAASRPPINLYILTDPKTPFDQDGFRDGHDIRDWMHQTFIDSLTMWGKDYLFVSGTPKQRLTQSTKVIDRLMQQMAGISGRELLS